MSATTRYLAVGFAVVSVTLVACSPVDGETLDAPPDERHAASFADGKADELFGECQLEHVLLRLNDPDVDADELVDEGLHRRAASNIVDYRTGTDDRVGTADDAYFRSIHDVDGVDYVGPVAMQRLTGTVDDYCADETWRSAEAVFSPAEYTDGFIDRVVDALDSAEHSVDIAMYRLRDHRVRNALGDAAARGVDVRLLFDTANGDHLDTPGSISAELEDRGVDVRYVNRNIHHKFAIVDGPHEHLLQASTAVLFTGSANHVFSAVTRYDDNTVFHETDPAPVLKMQREFNHLWENSRNLGWNDDLEYFETLPVDERVIPPREHLDVLFTSDNFRTTYSSRWGPGFRPIPFSRVVADELVELIESAESSIYIAAAYFRLRPIAEALLRRRNDDPELDIRVYLDQTEYIDESTHHQQLADLDDCLDTADGDRDVYDCRQQGLYFSFELVDGDIPVRFKTYSYHWHPIFARQMHHKYLIVDERTVASGSYNYSMNAEQNSMDNAIIYRSADYPRLVEEFVENFESIWNTGRPQQRYETFLNDLETAGEIDLVFEPMALDFHQVATLREAIRQRCPDVDDAPFRTAPQDHRTCEVD